MSTADEVMQFMNRGDEVKNVAETKANEASSRSHTIFRLRLESSSRDNSSSNVTDSSAGKMKFSQLNLVDLAGSEGVSKT